MGLPVDPMPLDNVPSFAYWTVSKPEMSQTEFKNLSGIFKNACERVLGKDADLHAGSDRGAYWWNVTKPIVATPEEFKRLNKAFKEACELAFGTSMQVSGHYSYAPNRVRPH